MTIRNNSKKAEYEYVKERRKRGRRFYKDIKRLSDIAYRYENVMTFLK